MKVLALLLLLGATASGDPKTIDVPIDEAAPTVSAAASPSEVKLGARFTVFVTATFDTGVEVNLREPIELGGSFEVRRKVSEDRETSDGRHVREWQLEVYPWELGDQDIPPIAVTFTAGGHPGQVVTNAVPVRVSGVLGDVDDPKLMRDSTPPVRLTSRDWFWLWISGSVLMVSAIITGYLLDRRRRRRRRVVSRYTGVAGEVPRRRIDMTSERALERLRAIEQSGVLGRDDDRKRGYADMVDVIRGYLGARYHAATLEMTTAELMRALARRAPAGELELVETWLGRCDIVRYGGFRPTADDAKSVLEAACELVLATTAQPTREAA